MRRLLAALLLVLAFAGHAQAQDNYCASVGAFNQSYTPAFPGCGNFVLDKLAAKPGLGFALRQESVSYNGPDINVQRTSDNAKQDIYNNNGVLNQGQLMAFCAGTTCGVDDWYNQGILGSSGNATQSTAANQPVIVSAGVLQTQNGKPTVYFGGNQSLNIAIAPASAISINIVNANMRSSLGTGQVDILVALDSAGVTTQASIENFNSYVNPSQRQLEFDGTSGVNGTLYKNGAVSPLTINLNELNIATGIVTSSTNGASIVLGSFIGNAFYAIADISEVNIWNNVAIGLSDRQVTELNQAQFYSIAGVQ